MNIQDPISDMLCRIRNAQERGKAVVSMPHSKLKAGIADILKQEGYINDYRSEDVDGKLNLAIELKYFEGRPVIEVLKRISRPSVRRYKGKDDLPEVIGGLGAAIISTSRGVMTDKTARERGIGGEVLCIVA